MSRCLRLRLNPHPHPPPPPPPPPSRPALRHPPPRRFSRGTSTWRPSAMFRRRACPSPHWAPICRALTANSRPRASAPEPARPAAPAAAAIQPRDEYMAAFRDVQAPDLPIAPLGADMQDSYSEFTPLDIDLSAFSLAPVGSDMGQLPRSPAGPIPDTSHLHLADEGNNG